MDLKDQIQRVTDPDEIDRLQIRKNKKLFISAIRRDWVAAGMMGAKSNVAIPYWYPSGRKSTYQIARHDLIYNRSDACYEDLLKNIKKHNTKGLEVRHDIGRSTGWLSTVTKHIDVLCDEADLEWVPIYDANARGIVKKRNVPIKEFSIEWVFGNKWPNKKYDWIKLEVDRVDINVNQALQHLKPNGILICMGTIEECQKWMNSEWAKNLKLEYQYIHSLTSKISFLCYSINTNGEKHD